MITELEIKITDRIQAMIHVYHTVAVHFADLHDTPERALEKGCINEIVPWRESRSWLYWRLRRLILENQLVKEIMRAQSNLLVEEGRAMLYRWFLEEKGATEVSETLRTEKIILTERFVYPFQSHVWWQQNQEIVDWLLQQQDANSIVRLNLNAVKKDAVISQIEDALKVGFSRLHSHTHIDQIRLNKKTKTKFPGLSRSCS